MNIREAQGNAHGCQSKPMQQFPEARKSQHASGIPTCLFVNRHAKMGLS